MNMCVVYVLEHYTLVENNVSHSISIWRTFPSLMERKRYINIREAIFPGFQRGIREAVRINKRPYGRPGTRP